MSKTAIITDSTAYLPPSFVKDNELTVIPLNLHWDGTNYRDGVNIAPSQFYDMLSKSKTIPTTSQPTYGEFEVIIKELAKTNEAIIAVLISSGISGTVDSALMAQKHLSDIPLHVVDSKSTSAGLALLVKALVGARSQGKSPAEMISLADKIVKTMGIFFMVDTMEYLYKGGRIGGASRFLGGALDIKPILYLTEEGKIDALEKVRTKKKAVQRIIDLAVAKAAGQPARVGVIHARALADAEMIKQELSGRMDCVELDIYELSPVVGTHVGPGTLGIAVHTVAY